MSIRSDHSDAVTVPAQVATLGFLLRELYDALQARVYADVAADGHPALRDAHSPVLRHLPPQGARVVDLARACGLTKQSVAYIVQDLEQLGYVRAEPDPQDRRAKLIQWTGAGERLVASLLRHSAQAEQQLASRIGETGAHALRRSLEAAVTAMR